MANATASLYRLSKHARDRLAERSTMTEQELTELLRAGAFVRLRSNYIPNLPQGEIDFFSSEYGLTFKEMRQFGMVTTTETYRYLLVWSVVDKRALTLVIAANELLIITVLYADDFSVHDWSDVVTDDKISLAQSLAERSSNPEAGPYELHIRWLDASDAPKYKTFNRPKILSISPLIPSLDDLRAIARAQVRSGRDIQVIVRSKRNPSVILIEESLQPTYSPIVQTD